MLTYMDSRYPLYSNTRTHIPPALLITAFKDYAFVRVTQYFQTYASADRKRMYAREGISLFPIKKPMHYDSILYMIHEINPRSV